MPQPIGATRYLVRVGDIQLAAVDKSGTMRVAEGPMAKMVG
jgi:hypothetical protein